MTYGQIAELAGSRRGARQVVRILHAMSRKHRLPWHRVVNAKGEIAVRDEEARYMQILYLREEGVIADHASKVDLARFQHFPQRVTPPGRPPESGAGQ